MRHGGCSLSVSVELSLADRGGLRKEAFLEVIRRCHYSILPDDADMLRTLSLILTVL